MWRNFPLFKQFLTIFPNSQILLFFVIFDIFHPFSKVLDKAACKLFDDPRNFRLQLDKFASIFYQLSNFSHLNSLSFARTFTVIFFDIYTFVFINFEIFQKFNFTFTIGGKLSDNQQLYPMLSQIRPMDSSALSSVVQRLLSDYT